MAGQAGANEHGWARLVHLGQYGATRTPRRGGDWALLPPASAHLVDRLRGAGYNRHGGGRLHSDGRGAVAVAARTLLLPYRHTRPGDP